MKYIIHDPHFHHTAIIKYCKRPFQNKYEMNDCIITNWNSKVKVNDEVYIGGDFALKCSKEEVRRLLKLLHGKKYFILGDHDKQIWQCRDLLETITPLMRIQLCGIPTTITHWCMRVWPKSHYNAWHLFGHSHGTLEPIGKSWDCGVDNNNFTPVSEEEIEEIMKNRPDNFNLIKKRR